MLFSYLYFPIRLYFSGKPHFDKVQSCTFTYMPTMNGGVWWYHVILNHSTKIFDVSDIYKPGEIVSYVSNDRLDTAILIGQKSPSLWNLIIEYKPYGFLIIFFAFALIILIIIIAIDNYEKILSLTLQKINKSITVRTTATEKVTLYIKMFIPILTALLFGYIVFTLVARAVLLVENVSEFIGNIVISYGIILVLFTPYLVRKLSEFVNSTENVRMRNIKAIVTTVIALFGVVEIIKFSVSHDFTKFDSLKELFGEFIKSLFE